MAGMLTVAEHLVAIRSHVDALASMGPREVDGAGAVEFFDAVFESADRLHAVAVRTLPTLESDGLWALGGARSFATWLARRAHLTHAKAKRMVRLDRALRDELPRTAAAVVTAGPDRVGVEQAEILATVAATSDARRQVLADPADACGERFLLDQARLLPADSLRTLARRWAAAADPEADKREYTDAADREYLDVAATWGGTHLSGFLTTEHGYALLVALDAVTGIAAKDDDRTSSQRRAGALRDLVRLALDEGRTGSTVRPHVNVLVDYPTLTAPAATAGVRDQLPAAGLLTGAVTGAVFEDGPPVPRAVLDRLMCDSDLTRTVFGPDSQLLNIGRTKRLFPRRLRRAIIARDKTCQYPTCTAPPRLCGGHHTQHWSRDHGNTDATTGVLLRWHHHVHVHNTGIEVRWNPGHGWQFIDEYGQPLRN